MKVFIVMTEYDHDNDGDMSVDFVGGFYSQEDAVEWIARPGNEPECWSHYYGFTCDLSSDGITGLVYLTPCHTHPKGECRTVSP